MIANKMTGEKGVLFTASYINKFYEMEQLTKTGFQECASMDSQKIKIL